MLLLHVEWGQVMMSTGGSEIGFASMLFWGAGSCKIQGSPLLELLA